MGKTQLGESEATNRQISSNTKHNSKQNVEKANERPEWLPDGWNVDFRTRQSGPNKGYGYKCYIDPHGKKFYSKLEVLRYLESIKGNSCTSKKEEECNTVHSPNNNAVEKSTVAKSTVEKSTLEKSTVEKCTVEESTVEKSTVEKSTAEDLPPGWIKEVKARKGGNGNRKDVFYTDPVSGYVFRSKKDVLRYLESGDISSCVLKPNKRQIQDEDKLAPISGGKKQKLKQSATKRQLFNGKEISDESSLELANGNSSGKRQGVKVSSGMMVAPVPTGESVGQIQLPENEVAHPPKTKKTSDPVDVQDKNRVVNVMENAGKMNHSNPTVSKSKEFNVAHRSSRRLAGVEPDQLTNNLTNEQTLQVPKRNLRKGRTVLDTDLANKSSQQLNGVLETGKVEDNKPDNPRNSQGLASEAHVLKENKLLASEIGKNGEICSSSNKSSNKKERQIPCRASKRLAGSEPELVSNSLSFERAPEYRSKKSKGEINADLHPCDGGPPVELVNGESSNKSRKCTKIPPITNDQLEKHENEEMNDEKSEPQQSFAFHYSWSDPSLEFAIKTLTGALPAEDSVGNRPSMISETDKFPEYNLFENAAGSSSDKKPKANSSKSKNKKELKKEPKMPTRLSKRLAGREPEVLPAERALEYPTRKSGKDKTTADVILTNGASGHLHAEEEESKLLVDASDRLKTSECGKSSNGEKSYDAQTVPNDQLQRLEPENINNERSEPQFAIQFGDSWSDPCLEFAIKTLTGALPVDAADAVDLPVISPDVNDPPNKELLENVVQKSNEAAHDNSNHCQTEEELNTVCLPSKQIIGQPELRTSSTSCENDPKFATTESCSDEGNITRNLDGGQSLHIEAGNVTQIDINSLILEEPLGENEQVLEGKAIVEQPQPEAETTNHSNSERDFCASFMDSWSDPCLEFAFKTLTGAIPVEDDIAIQGCFQEPANHHDERGGGSTLPEIGSSSISQSDIGEKSMPGQQASMSSSFLTPEKSSPHGWTGVDITQRHYSQYNNNFQQR